VAKIILIPTQEYPPGVRLDPLILLVFIGALGQCPARNDSSLNSQQLMYHVLESSPNTTITIS